MALQYTQMSVNQSEMNEMPTMPPVAHVDQFSSFSVQLAVMALALLGLELAVVIGNLLVVIAVFVFFQAKSSTYRLIGSLAFADLFLGLFVLPFSAVQLVWGKWPFGELLCEIWLSTDVLCCTASIYLVLSITIERYIGTTRPLQYHSILSSGRVNLMVAAAWTLSLIISLAPYILALRFQQISTDNCEVNQNTLYALVSATISFYLPLVVVLILYIQIYRAAKRGSQELKCEAETGVVLRMHRGGGGGGTSGIGNTSGQSPIDADEGLIDEIKTKQGGKLITNVSNKLARFRKERKAAKTVGIVVGCFTMCWMPFFIILPIEAICPSCAIPKQLFEIFFWLGYCNSAMNPLIYGFASPEFKRAFTQILRCRLRQTKRSSRK
nr:G protein-coupled receptor [Proales similis]